MNMLVGFSAAKKNLKYIFFGKMTFFLSFSENFLLLFLFEIVFNYPIFVVSLVIQLFRARFV